MNLKASPLNQIGNKKKIQNIITCDMGIFAIPILELIISQMINHAMLNLFKWFENIRAIKRISNESKEN